LLADMQLARSEAVKEGSTVTICASSNGTSCSASTNGWSSGWIVFSDFTGSGTYSSTADSLIKIGAAFNSNDVITTAGTTAISSITFNREGFANLPATDQTSSAGVTLKLNVTPANVRWERCLNITWVGAMTTQRGGDASTACN
jgi:type IV fimbrial biogenesis protein FimT